MTIIGYFTLYNYGQFISIRSEKLVLQTLYKNIKII